MASSVLAAVSLLQAYHSSHLRNITITPPSAALHKILGRANATYTSFCAFARVFLQGALHRLRPSNVEPPDADDLSEADIALRLLLEEARALRPLVQRAAASVLGVVAALFVGRQLHYLLSSLPLSRQPLLFFFELWLRSLDVFERLLIKIYHWTFPRLAVRAALDGLRSLCFGLAAPKAKLARAANDGEKMLLSAVFSLARAALLQLRILVAALAHMLFDHKVTLSLWEAVWEASLAYIVTLALVAGGVHAMLLVLLTPVGFFRLADADSHALSLIALFNRCVAPLPLFSLSSSCLALTHFLCLPSLFLSLFLSFPQKYKEAAWRRFLKRSCQPPCAAPQTRARELSASMAPPRLQGQQGQQQAGDREEEEEEVVCRESQGEARFSRGKPYSSSSRSAQAKFCSALALQMQGQQWCRCSRRRALSCGSRRSLSCFAPWPCATYASLSLSRSLMTTTLPWLQENRRRGSGSCALQLGATSSSSQQPTSTR
jgi:hypothetical protein